jgi:blocked early in transport 1
MAQYGATPRFGASAGRDSRNDLFRGYTGAGAETRRTMSASPSQFGGYGYSGGSTNGSASSGSHLAVENRGYRPATPNSRCVAAILLQDEG